MGLSEKLEIKKEEQAEYKTKNASIEDLNEINQELLVRLRATESYLSVLLKEGTMKEIAITEELKQINEVSKRLQKQMTSTFMSSTNDLKSVNDGYREDILTSITELMKLIKMLNSSMTNNNENLKKELTKNRDLIEQRLKQIEINNKNSLNEMQNVTSTMVQNARKSILVNDWLDALKYGGVGGLTSSVILAALYYFFVM